MLSRIKIIGLTVGALIAAACVSEPAEASGYWTLNARQCPDLIEDRRDQRITWSRADRREDVRDARRVNCPAHAYHWVPAHGARHVRRELRGGAVVFVSPRGRYVVRDHRGRDIDVRIRFDLN
ncbi:MAG: hypothetical protein AAFX09_02770 [Pseudomonadota bacterium]